MQEIVLKDLKTLEIEYLSKNNLYKIEQEFLSWSKSEIEDLIETFEFSTKSAKTIYILWINNIKRSKEYKNWSEMYKFFREKCFIVFENWWELEEKQQILNKVRNRYLLDHTNVFEKNNYQRPIETKSIPIKRVIWSYTRLPDNLRRNIRCPFPNHRDRSPSMRIYEENESFNCFWCWRAWNSLNFIAEMEDISTKEAYKKLINLYTN